MRVLCAPDKLRGALDAASAGAALAQGVRQAGGDPVVCPVADGGEGTLQALVGVGRALCVEITVADALGHPRIATLGDLSAGTYLVEAAEAIGLGQLREADRNPRRASSLGVGTLICAAIERNARRILVALGGVATVDGGLGMLAELGAHVPGTSGADLLAPSIAVDLEPVRALLGSVELVVLHDVDVPLCGPDGAAALFGPQKGLTPADVPLFDAGLARLADALGGQHAARAGAGAAGGLGLALYSLGARSESGGETVLDLLNFDARLADVELCLTAEGSVDRQSARGKAVAAVVGRCVRAGVPCDVLGGVVSPDAVTALQALGARSVRAIGPSGRPRQEAFAAAADELAVAAADATRTISSGGTDR